MDAADLRIFEAVARTGGITRAAAELNTVQSNVTARIRLLEHEVGALLFERHSRGVTLTSAGQRLLPYAARIALLFAEAGRALRDDGTPKGPLNLGSLETTTALRLPSILTGYAAGHPEVDLSISTGTTAGLIEDVLAHRLEGAFVAGPVQHPDLDEEIMFREELVLVTPRSLASLDALARWPDLKVLVLRAGCSYRQRLEGILAGRGIVGVRRLEFGTLEGIVACVAAGIGVTLLPRGVVSAAWREGQIAVHELAGHEARVDTVFVRRRDAFMSSALSAFLACARPTPTPSPQAAE
jgi:DNA-binding transcriptional LysR family regulator